MHDSVELIHKDLAEEASWGLASLDVSWAKHQAIDPFMVIWPSRTIHFNGQHVNDSVPFMLPHDTRQRYQELRQRARESSAWAIMLCEQRATSIVVIFESPVGTRSWHRPIERHGDVRVLGEPREFENTDYIGVLCSPPKLTAAAASQTDQ